MSISPFFHALGSAYQAEMDDLASDSEGKDVLRQRLTEKRIRSRRVESSLWACSNMRSRDM